MKNTGPPRVVAPVLTAVMLVISWVGLASPAHAHSQLIGSSPASGEVVPTAPDEVSLEFNEKLIEIGSTILVVGADGENHAQPVQVDGRFARAGLAPDLADGSYEIRWRVVSADGHPISGRIPFAIGAEGDPVPQASATTTDSGATGEDQSDSSAGRFLLLGLAGAAIALVLWWALTARRSE